MVTSRMKRAGVLAALLWATALPSALAVPPGFNIQGRLTDANGVNREGNYSINREAICDGPEVPLCDEHGAHRTPTYPQIWARIAERRSSGVVIGEETS